MFVFLVTLFFVTLLAQALLAAVVTEPLAAFRALRQAVGAILAVTSGTPADAAGAV
jgi:hypothetical protein